VDVKKIKLIAMDLDGTLTQHKEPLDEVNKAVLDALSKRYSLLMVGAGQVMRIFNQLGGFPIDIIGNYGLQYGEYDREKGEMRIIRDLTFPVDKAGVRERIEMLRRKYGFTEYRGESVEYHPSGCITFPILGTKAIQEEKLSFDPDRKKRRSIYAEVCKVFSDYTVFVGGSSSFDMAPSPFDKAYALDLYCQEKGLTHDQVVYIGDDYGEGGNDESVYRSDFNYITIDSYKDFPSVTKVLLNNK
jgi:hydroxymethylpyrimidine pyrophosphatase-like HAD family hydrolase